MGSGGRQLDSDELQVLEKAEVLLLIKEELTRERLETALNRAGLLVTAMDDAEKAVTFAQQKHFSLILLDLDTPTSEAGLELLEKMQLVSPASFVAILCGRKVFDLAVQGFRRGAADVIAIEAEPYLIKRVTKLCLETRRTDERVLLLKETLSLHEEFLKRLIQFHKQAKEAEDLAAGKADRWKLEECIILVVDDNPRTASGLQDALGKEMQYRCIAATNGGEALDLANRQPFHLAMVKETLPDLSGTMVARSLRSQCKEGIVLLFAHPGTSPGYLSMIERSQAVKLIPELKAPSQLVDQIHELRKAYIGKSHETHYLQRFRQEHQDFIKQYAELRQRILNLLSDGKP